jgi:histidyl-tRNA synthetase
MASKLSTQPYRGTRDFLPAEMSVRTQVFSTLYRAIEAYGYTRYDGPILEPIEIYEAKSGHEIVSDQLYRLTDRGGRVLAIRPEMTPSVARMIAAHADTLQFPVRWYSHVNCHRYERPQRGRVREHWQINVDVFGSEAATAEVEIFELIHRMLVSLGASPDDFILRVSDRLLVESALTDYVGVPSSQMKDVFGVIDRWEKYPVSQSQEALAALGFTSTQIERMGELVSLDFEGYTQLHSKELLAKSNVARILLDKMTEIPLKFDPLIIRAFEYYTSTVFEVFDADPANRRALFGGGRYDNLVALFSEKRIPGIGFGMGDVTLMDFLDTHGLLPQAKVNPDVYMLPLDTSALQVVKRLADELRNEGLRVIVPFEVHSLKRAMKEAAKSGASFALILGEEELKRDVVILRDLLRSEQSEIPMRKLVEVFKENQ